MNDKVKCEYCDSILKNTPRSIGSHIGYHHKEVAAKIYDRSTEFTMHCKECNELVANSNNVLARHVRKEHKLDWPDYEVKHNNNNIWPTCACGCGEKLKWRRGGFGEFSFGHANRGELNPMFGKKGVNSPNSGKKRTDAMKAKYSKAAHIRWDDPNDPRREIMMSETYRNNMRNISKETSKRPEVIEKKSIGSSKWWNEHPEMRSVYSLRACSLLEQGKIGPQAPYKAEWKLNPFTNKEEYMHSSWETRFLDECIELNTPVTKQHGVRIPYTDPNGLEHLYIPDFLSLDGKTLYEIKGVETDVDREKWKATAMWCLQNDAQFEVIRFQ